MEANAYLSSSGAWCGAILAGYCFGCVNMAWLLAFFKNRNIKSMGNGNAGASNVLMTMGVKCGAVTAAWDILKAVLAYAFTCYALHGTRDMCMLAAGASVIGHCFPFWMDFDGGKGFAPFIGFMLCCDWKAATLPLAIGLVLALALDRIVLMTFTCAALWPLLLWPGLGWPYAAFYSLLSLVLFWRHRENVHKLIDGTEPGIRQAFRRK